MNPGHPRTPCLKRAHTASASGIVLIGSERSHARPRHGKVERFKALACAATVELVGGRIDAASETRDSERCVAARREKFTAKTSLCSRSQFAPRDRARSKIICRLSPRKRTRLAAIRQNATATEATCDQCGRSRERPAPAHRGFEGIAPISGLMRSKGNGNTMVEDLPLLDMSASVCR